MNRRDVLRGGIAFTVGAPTLIGAAVAVTTRQDLEHYYAFLWKELLALSEELGCEMCDSYTAHKSGGIDAYNAKFGAVPPSMRAKAFLAL